MSVFGVILIRISPPFGLNTERDREILLISPYSVRMRENTDHNNFEYGHFLRIENDWKKNWLTINFSNIDNIGKNGILSVYRNTISPTPPLADTSGYVCRVLWLLSLQTTIDILRLHRFNVNSKYLAYVMDFLWVRPSQYWQLFVV